MSNNKHTGFFAGRGYYIALILCAVAIGITGYVYYRNTRQPEQLSAPETEAVVPALQTEGQEDLPVMATKPDPGVTQTNPTQATQPAQVQKKALKTAWPLAGDTIAPYSMEALRYNATTRDWRVHNGVDIAAEEGTPVFAAADGEVRAVYEDDAMGHTVVLQHEGGYTTTYSSLDPQISVAPGDTVHMGQAIGVVGTSALMETAMGTHVHFGVCCQETPMDPAEFLALGK